MRVLAIDPGYDRLGVAVVENNNKEFVVYSDCIQTNKSSSYEDRLLELGNVLEHIITEYKPDAFACETLFFAKNQKTAINVAGARGMFLYIARKHAMPIYEYKPNQIKIAVTGYGQSDKKQVIAMISRLVRLDEKKRLDDEYDAIAIGLTCLAIEKY